MKNKLKDLEAYIKNHPETKFIFNYSPSGTAMGGDNRYWQVKFSKPIKDNHTIGYACDTFENLILSICTEGN